MKIWLLGGFLGSGKTTAIATAAKLLRRDKIPFAVITNDQGAQLADTALMNSLDIHFKEIKNGCFCCNYEQFHFAIRDLGASVRPRVILAEAVGSCTDLVATVIKPLLRSDPGIETSFCVFADGPQLLASLEGRSSFISDDVRYLYKKQLEESRMLIVNKCDLLVPGQIAKIKSLLKTEFPGKPLLFQNSMAEASVRKWLNFMDKPSPVDEYKTLEIDYSAYAGGEAALAWLDSLIVIRCKRDAVRAGQEFVATIHAAIVDQELAIGNLKFFLRSGNWQKKISYTGTAASANGDDISNVLADELSVIINARVETSPERLKQIFSDAVRKIENQNCRVEIQSMASFQPGYPKPTHRITS